MTVRSTTRLCSDKERRFLRNQRSALQRRRSSLWQRSTFAYVVIFGILAILTLWAEGKNPGFVLGFWGVLGGLITIPGFVQEWRRLSQKITAYDKAIASASAEDLTISARRFWEFEEQEDEGACYAFELVSGGVIFISGQDFYPGGRFPTTDFSIVEFRDSAGCVLDMIIEKRGTRTAPARVISAKQKAHLEIPEHGSFIPGTLDEVYAKLSRA
jgi:hypothetical protein